MRLNKFVGVASVIAVAFSASFVAKAYSDTMGPSRMHPLDDPGPKLRARFGKAPPAGVHPRILMGPKELPALRRLVQDTSTGKFILGRVESFLDVLHGPGKPLAAVYDHLIAGDPEASGYAENDWWKGLVVFAVSLECYDALIREDEARGARAARALTTLAKAAKSQWNDANKLFSLALGYDFAHAYMTDEQRAIVRATIAAATNGKKPYGADLPPDWRNYNWMPNGMTLLLSALAIEGEEGYDPAIYPSSLGVMKDFLHYGISDMGAPDEEMHYFHYGMSVGALAMAAFARHGDDVFAEPHYRALVNWLIASMEPFGDAFSMHQDTPNDVGGPAANYAIMKWVWPDDPALDAIWRNRLRTGYEGLGYYGDWLAPAFFPSDPKQSVLYAGKPLRTKWGTSAAPRPPGYPNPVAGIEALHAPLSFWDPEQGLLITRNKWGADGLTLHFAINAKAGGPSHFHSNSTTFTLSALGRKWAIDRGFHIAETKDSSLVLIDGRGQGFFPVGGATAEHREEGSLTVIAGDAAKPYHWMTTLQNSTGAPHLAGFSWAPDTSATTVKKFAERARADVQHPWNDGAVSSSYPYRAAYNPVEKAFRTAALRRGDAHSYVMIVDDIKKDASSHRYDWLMQVADDLEIKGNSEGAVVLGGADPLDDRRLFVKMLDAESGGEWELENYEIKRSPETGDTSSFGMGKRLKYSLHAVEPRFKVMLYPFREGEAPPSVSWVGHSVAIAWPNQKDTYEFNNSPSGRTETRLVGSHVSDDPR